MSEREQVEKPIDCLFGNKYQGGLPTCLRTLSSFCDEHAVREDDRPAVPCTRPPADPVKSHTHTPSSPLSPTRYKLTSWAANVSLGDHLTPTALGYRVLSAPLAQKPVKAPVDAQPIHDPFALPHGRTRLSAPLGRACLGHGRTRGKRKHRQAPDHSVRPVLQCPWPQPSALSACELNKGLHRHQARCGDRCGQRRRIPLCRALRCC